MSFGQRGGGVIRVIADKYINFMNLVERIIWRIAIIIFIILTLVVVGSVISRQLLGFVPNWSGELQRYLAIWMTLLVSGALINTNDHLGVRIFFNRLPLKVAFSLRLLQLGIILIIGVVFINWGTTYVLDSGFASRSPSMEFHMAWVYLILPITGWLFILFSIARAIKIHDEPEEMGEGRVEELMEDE